MPCAAYSPQAWPLISARVIKLNPPPRHRVELAAIDSPATSQKQRLMIKKSDALQRAFLRYKSEGERGKSLQSDTGQLLCLPAACCIMPM